MNNGIMWFDPRPGRPNSIRPGRRPLSNMCPAILVRDDGQRFAMGAAGGRRILPAVMQLISFLVDYRMGVGEAVHHPRIDVSGTPTVAIDGPMPGPALRGEPRVSIPASSRTASTRPCSPPPASSVAIDTAGVVRVRCSFLPRGPRSAGPER